MPPKAKTKAKARAKPAAKAKAVDRYAYLPTDLQRAAVHMDRADFLRCRKASTIASAGTPRCSMETRR